MATIISNQATATYTFDGSTETRNASSNIANTTLLDDYSLEVSFESLQENFTPGENITFIAKVTNTGVKPLTSFIISDSSSDISYLEYLPNSARLIYDENFLTIVPTDINPLTFEIPNTLNPDESLFIIYTKKVSSTIDNSITSISNTITASALSGYNTTDTTRYSDSDTVTLTRYSEANLIINKTVSKSSIYSNDTYDYIINITNNGLIEARDVVITDSLPAGFNVNNITVQSDDGTIIYSPTDYNLTEDNVLTLPSSTGAKINVKALELGNDHSTTIIINGTYSSTNN